MLLCPLLCWAGWWLTPGQVTLGQVTPGFSCGAGRQSPVGHHSPGSSLPLLTGPAAPLLFLS